jgi:protein-L-isoaspartate O-methyltransferase
VNVSVDVGERERAFWDEHVPPLERVITRLQRGPDPNTRAMLDALEPLRGARVLDFACGAGLTSAFLALRGARVTAIDISPASTERAAQLVAYAGLDVEIVTGELGEGTFAPASFDAITGRFALHHVDLPVLAPILGELLVAGGRGAFLETMGLNPLLNLSRRQLAGRWGVASYGSEDERPLERADLRVLERSIGTVKLSVASMQFLRVLERNVLRGRQRRLSRALAGADDLLLAFGASRLSYHQVVKLHKPLAAGAPARAHSS